MIKYALWIKPFNALINRTCLQASILFLLLMISCVCIQIIARYIFASPPAWTEELARYAMIYSALLGACSAYYQRADPSLFPWKEFETPLKQRLLQLLEASTVSIFCLPILWFSPATILRLFPRETETLGISSGLVLLIIPLAFAVIFWFSISRLLLTLLQPTLSTQTQKSLA